MHADVTPAVRMAMTGDDGERFARTTANVTGELSERLHDQLWLRTILIEQRRRTRRAERRAFDERADRLLAALDPQPDEDAGPAHSHRAGEPSHGADRDDVRPGCGGWR